MTPDITEYYLGIWSRWMNRDDTNLGAPFKSVGFSTGGGIHNVEDWDAAENGKAARAVDAIILGLPEAQKIAVMITHGQMADVWRFRESIDDLYGMALVKIGAMLDSRGFV